MHQARWSVTGRHLATVQRPLACFLLSDRLKETSDYWSVQGQRGNLFGRQSVSGNLHKMLITLSPALQLSLSVSDCEWLSHCSALYHSPRGATGTKGGSSCRFKRMCSAQLVRLLLGLSFFFLLHLRCDRKASPNVLSWAVLPINTALSARGRKGVSAVKICFYPPCVGHFHVG